MEAQDRTDSQGLMPVELMLRLWVTHAPEDQDWCFSPPAAAFPSKVRCCSTKSYCGEREDEPSYNKIQGWLRKGVGTASMSEAKSK